MFQFRTFSSFLLGFCLLATWAHGENLRLIELNETTRIWMTEQEVLKLADECGKPDQNKELRGFMDVTDHPDLKPSDIYQPSIPKTLSYEDKVRTLATKLSKKEIENTIKHLSSYKNRYYTSQTGKESAEWIRDQFKRIIEESGRSDASVELFPHSWAQSSVVARIQGTGDGAKEKVIIGAHEDSIAGFFSPANSRAPGADDDASGTSTVLEVFRVLVSDPTFTPSRTVEFHTYAAEEVGLRGSQDIASSYSKNKVPVAGMIQFDMTGYKNGKPALVQDFVNGELTSFLQSIAKRDTNVEWATTKCGYGCSDHASWTKAGYAACFPFESDFSKSNGKIHTDSDLIQLLDLDQCLEFAKLGLSFIVELSQP